jgi:hypothetical protein
VLDEIEFSSFTLHVFFSYFVGAVLRHNNLLKKIEANNNTLAASCKISFTRKPKNKATFTTKSKEVAMYFRPTLD